MCWSPFLLLLMLLLSGCVVVVVVLKNSSRLRLQEAGLLLVWFNVVGTVGTWRWCVFYKRQTYINETTNWMVNMVKKHMQKKWTCWRTAVRDTQVTIIIWGCNKNIQYIRDTSSSLFVQLILNQIIYWHKRINTIL